MWIYEAHTHTQKQHTHAHIYNTHTHTQVLVVRLIWAFIWANPADITPDVKGDKHGGRLLGANPMENQCQH